MISQQDDLVIEKLLRFGRGDEHIRAIVLTSSRCNANAPVDIFSDYDVEIFVDDPAPFAESDDWVGVFGPVLNKWRDVWCDGRVMRMFVFEDGTKMDIVFGCLDILRAKANSLVLPEGYDIGYRVLLDKDGVTANMPHPTYSAFILIPPNEARYLARLDGIWNNSIYVAKFLWRGDIMAAKNLLNDMANRQLRELLEWHIAGEHEWRWRPGAGGRGIQKVLDPELYAELLASYTGGGEDELWQSLFRTLALCRKAAIEVASKLGFTYPHENDRRMEIYLETIRTLDRASTNRDDLARALREAFRE